ncbi:exonuclease SbcCD subunit D [Treponema phagedenis]|uniref:Nuclease SbcCD subunit D n=1 Tax=Treponema phagedenis TaxID=162 RepID=A0A0B7GY19_TREPH|nr:exonuclease SbcCD subunit D [Treponema phagedenis]QSI00343.1 exonuclease SbcCD subunit D [Treponema phagedenis]CEM61880.1 Exonuclease SbcCD, D subunit [Treponema phagedenis]
MKILHTADLHLGKSLHEFSLYEQQKKMLHDIRQILSKDDYAAFCIAGDVYDRSIPPADSVSLFSSFLTEIKADNPELSIYIIPGNHDSAQRLSFASELLKGQNIFIHQDPEKSDLPYHISHNGEEAAVFLLPFLNLGAFSYIAEDKTEKLMTSQSEMLTEASRRLKKTVPKNMPSILIAHLFTLAGKSSSSERVFVGLAEQVDPALFDFFSYAALGHLHKPQKITERMYYSGAPLPYSFDEADDRKSVLSVDIDCKTEGFPVTVTEIPIAPLIPLRRLEGTFEEFHRGSKFAAYENDFLEIQLTDSLTVANPMGLLKTRYPRIMNIKQPQVFFQTDEKTNGSSLRERKLSANDPQTLMQNFQAFQKEIESDASPEKKEVFTLLCKQIQEER